MILSELLSYFFDFEKSFLLKHFSILLINLVFDFSKLKKYNNRFDEIIVKVRYVTT